MKKNNIMEFKKILKKIKSHDLFRNFYIKDIPISYLIHPTLASNLYRLISGSTINVRYRHFLINILKHFRNFRENRLNFAKLKKKDVLFMIFNKREIHEEISKFFQIMDKKRINLIIREPYFFEFGTYKKIPKGINYSFFYSYLDSDIKKEWRKERIKIRMMYKQLINDDNFKNIFFFQNRDNWKEARIIIKNFFFEELYWSAVVILIAEKIIRISKPKIYVAINVFSYCTREVAWTMKKKGVKVITISEGLMNYDKNITGIVFNEVEIFKNLIDFYMTWGNRDKILADKYCKTILIGSTRQPHSPKNIRKLRKTILITLSTHAEIYNKKQRDRIISDIEKVIKSNPNFKFVQRLHPSGLEKEGWYKQLEQYKNYSLSKKDSLYTLITRSEYMIAEASTVATEAPIIGTEVIIYNRNIDVECIHHPIYFKVNNADMINEIIQKKKKKNNKYKKHFIYETIYKHDFMTHKRIKIGLDHILKKKNE